MGITYRIDVSKGVVFEEWLDTLSADEIAEHWKKKYADLRVMAAGRTLLDVRACKLPLSGDDLRCLVKTILVPTLRNRKMKTAILVNQLVQYGVARQFLAYIGETADISIFEDEAEALEWLVQERGLPDPLSARPSGT